MKYAVIAVPAAPVRRRPLHRKEMVSQLLFGESVKVLKERGDLWVKIRSLHDGYEGWITNTMLLEVDEAIAANPTTFVTKDLLSAVTIDGKKMNLPVGSSLPFLNEGKGKLGEKEYSFTGKFLKRAEQVPSGDLIKKLTAQWLNAPYMWGGRTPLGVDCSGFVQVIFKQMGIDLPRDAWQQAQEGKALKKFGDIQTGDLVFFDNKEDIVHVGIMLNATEVIHAAGKVRIDAMDKKGIVNAEGVTPNRRLRAIRRFW